MKPIKYFTFLAIFLATAISVNGQVMISQYIETNSGTTPKGIEVYNYSNSDINFSSTPLEVHQGTNGGACTSIVTINTNTLHPNKVWVIGTQDLIDYATTNGSDLDGTTFFDFQFNGNDALELYLNTTIMDIIGTCGSDPGAEWDGSGVSTKDQNIAVKFGVCTGTTDYWIDPSLRFKKISDGNVATGFGKAPNCSSNTIDITTVSTSPFTVDCSNPATGTVDFTSVGTFTSGNVFTAELSDASGSFANPYSIGTLNSSNSTGTISITIPANYTAGTGYRIRVIGNSPGAVGSDNGTDLTIVNSAPCIITECMIEDFENIPANVINYTTHNWIGYNGAAFQATDARTNNTLNGKAITIRKGSLTVNNIPGGISALRLTTQREYAGGSGTIDIFINNTLVGTAPYNASIQSTTINGINLTGPIDLEIVVDNNGDRVKIDDLKWICYSALNTVTVASVNTLSYTVDCNASATGNLVFNSTGDFTSGNTFTAELSDETGSFINYLEIGSLSLSGTDPTGIINFTIPANTISGTAYRMRVVSDTPYSNVTDNGNDISINNTQPCIPIVPLEGALLINEFSNGPSGNKEYYELLVVGKCGDSVDLRSYILDDNNGEFGLEGLSPGHLKLANHVQWSKVAVGSIIVIYYANDKNNNIPEDDPTDSDLDNVYIIPHTNSSLLSIYNDYPNSNDFSYGLAANTSNAWTTTMGLNNQNDAVQSRFPNGSLFFGISYGNAMTGGAGNLNLTNNALTSKNAYFTSGEFRNINNWRVGNAPINETPGAANNAANHTWIDMLRDPFSPQCALIPLPVSMTQFTGEYKNGEVELYWKTATELNNAYYELFHSKTGYEFESIGKVDGHGTVSTPKEYNFTHRNSSSGIHYYRLKSVDYDGENSDKGTISVQIKRDKIQYDASTQTLHFPNKGKYHVYSISGKKVLETSNQAQVHFSEKGFFLVYNVGSGVVTKIVVS